MSDIVERLDEPEAHYPGNFDTPKRANAMLSCLCQEAKDEIETLRQQLAEKDAEIEQLKSSPPEKREYLRCVISDLCQQVRERDEQLAASQAREAQLREALDAVQQVAYRSEGIAGWHMNGDIASWDSILPEVDEALALPQDATALEAMIAEAGELMRERCSGSAQTEMDEQNLGSAHWHAAIACREAIRNNPGVTLEDLRK